MNRFALLLMILLVTPACLTAQDKPSLEIGMRAGFSLVLPEEGSILNFAVPGGGASPVASLLGGSSTVHFAFFPTPQIMVEPQLSFSVLSVSNGDTETLTTVGVTGQVAYLFTGAMANSAYVGFSGSFFSMSNGGSESDFAVGGTVGYRFLPRDFMAIRIEASYRRWFDFELNEINGAIILGFVLD
ncbi:MAG: hypothetical protein GTO46_08415 [Gemmatimonadetes bacterium]|nr:hypothetical protein [Gemmatimonadota bacterium]NIO31660.1 hypothetical protein [Gemmatimonadota bacterium]